MVNELLNDDGTTNEYLHLLVGECEDALDGDGTIPGGGGGGVDPCITDPTGSSCDPDNDNLTNAEEDALGTDPDDADTDDDGRNDNVDKCPLDGPSAGQIENPDSLGCWIDPDPQFPADQCNIVLGAGCNLVYPDGDSSFISINNNFPFELSLLGGSSSDIGSITFNIDANGDLEVLGSLDGVTNIFGDYGITVIDDAGNLTEFDSECTAIEDGSISRKIAGSFSYPILVRFKVELCSNN